MNTRAAGSRGEELAAGYLKGLGMEILERNFRTRSGEVDIIARDGVIIVFVEVKNWPAYGSSELEYGLDRRKQQRIIRVSREFLSRRGFPETTEIRYDVVFLGRKTDRFEHFINAFTETGTV